MEIVGFFKKNSCEVFHCGHVRSTGWIKRSSHHKHKFEACGYSAYGGVKDHLVEVYQFVVDCQNL